MELLEVLMSYDSLLSFITSLLAIIIVHNYYDRFTQSCPITKGPWRLPVLGNTLNALLNYHRRLDYLIDQTKTYGPVFRFDLMFKRGTIVTCPQVVEYITQSNFKNYEKGSLFTSRLMPLLGRGILNVDGPGWKVQRKTASHMFNTRSLRETMTRVFQQQSLIFLQQIPTDPYIDVQNFYARFTLDTIGKIAFGHNINSLKDRDAPFAKAYDQASYACTARFVNPIWKWTTYFLPLEYKLRTNCNWLRTFALEIIHSRRQDKNNLQHDDVLGRYMQMKDENGNPYSDSYLQDMVMNFVLAGRDAPAVTLTWLTYYLTQHPQVQDKVIAEIDQVLKGNAPHYEAMQEMSYLHSVVYETLRLSPALPVEVKSVVEDDILPTGHRVYQGDFVVFLPYIINRNDVLYPDPEEFRPERWNTLQPTPFKFPTFNAGYRLCPGKSMAILEIKILMASILQKYRLVLKPQHHAVRIVPTVTLPIKGGLLVQFSHRHKQ